jgi:hypothetical protein
LSISEPSATPIEVRYSTGIKKLVVIELRQVRLYW